MDVNASGDARVLVVADWAVDPHGVIAACRRRAADGDTTFALVVPAMLHGIDWIGDPRASQPCAARQLDALTRLAESARLRVAHAEVGDPDPTSAVDDALQDFAASEILVCHDKARRGHPLDLVHRLRRTTGLPVEALSARRRPVVRERRGWSAVFRGGGHCVAEAA